MIMGKNTRRAWWIIFVIVSWCYMTSCARLRGGAPLHRIDIDRLQLATYAVVAQCPGGTWQGGTAFAIGGHHLVTAAHVITCASGIALQVRASSISGRVLAVELDEIQVGFDVARLRTTNGATMPAWIDVTEAPPHVGTPSVVATAIPIRGLYRDHVVSYMPRVSVGLSSMLVEHGNSGAGVFDQWGRLIGIVTRIYPCDIGHQTCGMIFSTRTEIARMR